jgi:hypothetical protein
LFYTESVTKLGDLTVLFKFLLASMKTLPNYGYFTGSRTRIPPPTPSTRLAATQRECEPQFNLQKNYLSRDTIPLNVDWI